LQPLIKLWEWNEYVLITIKCAFSQKYVISETELSSKNKIDREFRMNSGNEIKRELAVMKKAGIGGIEINSIAMPTHAKKTDAISLQWAGKEWCNMVKVASEEAKELGMITDLIVGSGWPFGGRFMEEDQIVKDAIQEVLNAENVIKMGAPAESVDLVDWTSGLMRKIQLEPQATKFLISGYRLK
jgi:hypothetical protein